jgi:SAM-dependent methyltransferase
MDSMTTPEVQALPQYTLKHGPYSSHSLLLRQLPADGAGRRVLDVGCASGYLSEILTQRGFQVTAIDRYGIAPPPGTEFIEADLDEGLPPLPRCFDYIICADVLEHLRDPLRMLGDCDARLAPGGALILSLPNSGHWYFRWNVLVGRFPQHDRGLFDRTHLHFYTWDGWVELLHDADFAIQAADCAAVPIGLALPRWEGSIAVRAMERISYVAASMWKRLFAYQFIVRVGAGRR